MTTFVNVRSNCYFNALMQALLSCKHFNEWAKKQKGAVIDEYLKILNNPKPQSTNIPILNAMQRVLRTGDKHMQRFGFSQECADEGLKFFINCVGAESQFATRYDSHIVCRVCKSKSDPKKDINIFVNVADCDLFLGKVEEGKINKYLLSHTFIIAIHVVVHIIQAVKQVLFSFFDTFCMDLQHTEFIFMHYFFRVNMYGSF